MLFFRKQADKINKRLQDDEEITFKRYDDVADAGIKSEPQAQLTAAAPAANNAGGAGSVLRVEDSAKDGSIKFKIMRPESFDEVSNIADQLIAGCTVVFNAELLDRDTCQRMLLFLNGVTYTTDGDISHVSQNTYIITPHDVDVSDEG